MNDAKKIVKGALQAFVTDEKLVKDAMSKSEIGVMDMYHGQKDENNILKYGGKHAINISLHLSQEILKDIPMIPKLKEDKSNQQFFKLSIK